MLSSPVHTYTLLLFSLLFVVVYIYFFPDQFYDDYEFKKQQFGKEKGILEMLELCFNEIILKDRITSSIFRFPLFIVT